MTRIFVATICLLLAACQSLPPSPKISPLPEVSQRPSPSQSSVSGALPIPVSSPSVLETSTPLPKPSMTPQSDLILPASALTVLAGADEPGFQDGIGGMARFNQPNDMVLDANGNLYIADTNNHLIRKVTLDGTVTTWAGAGKPGDADGSSKQAEFRFPRRLTIDDIGQIFLIDDVTPSNVSSQENTSFRRIRKINNQGIVSTLYLDTLENFNTPFFSIFWDKKSHKIYLTSFDSVFSVDERSKVKKLAGKEAFSFENSGLAGAVNSIKEIKERDSLRSRSAAERYPNTPFLTGINTDSNGNLIIVDDNAHLLWKLTFEGQALFWAGGAHLWWDESSVDGCNYMAGFYSISDVIRDELNHIYVSDHRLVRIISEKGCVSTIKIPKISEKHKDINYKSINIAIEKTRKFLYLLTENKVYKLGLQSLTL